MKHWRAGGWETGISGSAGGRRKRPAQAGPRRRPTRSREPAPAAPTGRPDPSDSRPTTPSASYLGQAPVGPGAAMLHRLAGALGVRHARHGGALASTGLAPVRALEVAFPRRPSSSQPRGAGADRRHVPLEPALGHRADPRRAAQAGHRGQQIVRFAATAGVDRGARRARSGGTRRVCPVLQPGKAAPDTAPPDAGADAALGRGAGAITASAWRSASPLRTSSLTTGRVLRPHTTAGSWPRSRPPRPHHAYRSRPTKPARRRLANVGGRVLLKVASQVAERHALSTCFIRRAPPARRAPW